MRSPIICLPISIYSLPKLAKQPSVYYSCMTLRQVLHLVRPHTLPASLAPVVTALALAALDGFFCPTTAILTVLVGVLAQIVSNIANDLFDFKKGADGKDRKGFERPLSLGKISYREVKCLLIVSIVATSLTGIALILLTSPWLSIVGALVILGAIAYTGGPFPFAYHGLGEVMVFLFYGLVAGGGTYYIQCGTLSWEAIALASAMGLASCNILVVNNYRDVAEDALSGKRTLFVRFGKSLAPKLYLANVLLSVLLLFPFYSIIGMLSSGIYLAQMMHLQRTMLHTEGAQLNKVLVRTAQGVVLFALNALIVIFVHYQWGAALEGLHHH